MEKMISVPEWETISMGAFNQSELYRHFLFLGETGSGKTSSGLKPLCNMAFSPESSAYDPLSAALVVDPKGELGCHLEGILRKGRGERLVRLNKGLERKVLWLFEDMQIEGRDSTSVINDMLSFSESYHNQKHSTHDAFWIEGASRLLASLVAIDLTLFRNGNRKGVENIKRFWLGFYALLNALKDQREEVALHREVVSGRVSHRLDGLKDQKLEVVLLELLNNRRIPELALASLLKADGIGREDGLGYQRGNYLHHLYAFFSASSYYAGGLCSEKLKVYKIKLKITFGEEPYNLFWALFIAYMESFVLDDKKAFSRVEVNYFQQFTFMATSTYSSFQAVFNSFLHELVDPEFVAAVSVNPFEPPQDMLSIKKSIDAGRIVVYEPGVSSPVTSCIGKVMKAAFFRMLLDKERLNNPEVRPFFYICDEFQRFITHDPESGEQSFLDRCRAYRVCCALATQSVGSLRYAFPGERGDHSIQILLTNTGTKYFFRTTDPDTASQLTWLFPESAVAGKPHVVRVRPPTTLAPGECYYVRAGGSVGRGQIVIDRGI
ncbi:MAG: type IV secretory system conjugative DNA transfer family protein [Deltaproteobacteria bacterium]|nr:type IV secretory system conjugative DNA transfer family protein [Deltaproteobacteria bacterium]